MQQDNQLLIFFAFLQTASDYGHFLRADIENGITQYVTEHNVFKSGASDRYKSNRINKEVKRLMDIYDRRLRIIDTFVDRTNENNPPIIIETVDKIAEAFDASKNEYNVTDYAALLGLSGMMLTTLVPLLQDLFRKEKDEKNRRLVMQRYYRLGNVLLTKNALDLLKLIDITTVQKRADELTTILIDTLNTK